MKIHNFNLIPPSKRKEISKCGMLLQFLQSEIDCKNFFRIQKNQVANVLGVKRRTVTDWLDKLCSVDVLKYKYSGHGILNPEFFFDGSEDDYYSAIGEYKDFKSDVY